MKVTEVITEDGSIKFTFHAIFSIILSLGLCVCQKEVAANSIKVKAKATRSRITNCGALLTIARTVCRAAKLCRRRRAPRPRVGKALWASARF